MTDRDGLLGVVEERAPTLFLIAGGLLVILGANQALKTFVGTSYPVVQNFVGPAGFLVGVIGLFGLYPALADRTPKLARAAAAVATILLAGWVAIIGMSLARAAGIISESGGPLAVVPFVVIASMILTFALFGVTSLRTGAHPRPIGALLLVEAAMFLLLVLNAAPFVLIDVGHVLAFVGVGVTLRTGGVPTESGEPATDATT